MDAGPLSIKKIFETDRRLVVPLFQRPYVWNQADQWEPLWEDIRAIAERVLAGKEVRPHFLGAIVLDQERKPTGHLETRTIIDGQQRLTTLQLFLEAFCDLCLALGEERHHRALRKLTRNSDPMSDALEDEYKIWPTNRDRAHFQKVMAAAAPADLLKSYGKKQTSPGVGLQIADAYCYFHRCIEGWITQGPEEPGDRIAALYGAVRENIRMVVIDLDAGDDPQMIFETLNARGTPLLPSDLIKNFLFHEMQHDGSSLDAAYEKYWHIFDEDDEYWRALVGRGHARRARIDSFLQHYLTLQVRDEVPVGHLYTSFRDYVRDSKTDARYHLEQLHDYGQVYSRFDAFPVDSAAGAFMRRLGSMDVTTAYPFLLEFFARVGDEGEAALGALKHLESWLVRRMVCQLNTRGYNRLFIDMLAVLDGPPERVGERVHAFLLQSDAESQRWPDDREFRRAWLETPLYERLVQERVRMLLEAIEMRLRTAKTERIAFQEKLTIEHLMPQEWRQHWPLPASLDQETAQAERQVLIHTMGNLTLLTVKLNPSVSNGPWSDKRLKIDEHSVLKLNQAVVKKSRWDEAAIQSRGEELFTVACRIWPAPGASEGE